MRIGIKILIIYIIKYTYLKYCIFILFNFTSQAIVV